MYNAIRTYAKKLAQNTQTRYTKNAKTIRTNQRIIDQTSHCLNTINRKNDHSRLLFSNL